MNLLLENRQTGAYKVLENVPQHIKDASNHKHLLNLRVKHYGNITLLKDFLSNFSQEEARNLLEDNDIKAELLERTTVSVEALELVPQLADSHPLYIPRQMSNQLFLDEKLFKCNCSDVFVFTGIPWPEVLILVSPQIVRSSGTQTYLITSRHIYLENDDDWAVITRQTAAPVHLICKHPSGAYSLIRSTYLTTRVRDFISYAPRQTDSYQDEASFAKEIL